MSYKKFSVLFIFLILIFGCEKEIFKEIQPETFTLTGTVSDISDNKLSDAVVMVNAVSDTTDSLGMFTIEDIVSGDSRLTIEHPLYSSLDTLITVEIDTTLTIILSDLPDTVHTVTGTIISNKSKAVSGATVKIGTKETATDENGGFSLDIADGEHLCLITHSAYTSIDTTLTILEDSEIDFLMNLDVVIDGYVNLLWEDEYYPIEGAVVDMSGIYSGGHYYKVETDSTGYFSINDGGSFAVTHILGDFTNKKYSNYTDTYSTVSKTFTITLETLLEEYFPLEIGNEWVYDYSYSKGHSGYMTGEEREGTLTLKIAELESTAGIDIYHCLSIFSGTERIYEQWPTPIDSTYVVDADTTLFDITCSDNQIYFEKKAFTDYLSTTGHLIPCKQQYPYIFPETLDNEYIYGDTSGYDGFIKLRKSVGFESFIFYSMFNTSVSVEAELSSYSLE